ncbi:MAG: glycosyltransferase [Myxococcota bacterium]|nr:glycosyltransferase [Myxococcota bacterium]
MTSGLEASPALRARLGYRKFAGSSHVVLLLDSGYHLQRECGRALRRLGHQVVRVPVGGEFSPLLQKVLQCLVRHRPDFVLSINHLGFDEGGYLGSLLANLQVPLAVWYVDSPGLILQTSRTTGTPWVSAFLWERSLRSQLDRRGYPHTKYLPLGTDPEVFFPRRAPQQGSLTFIGSSNEEKLGQCLAELKPANYPLVVRLAREILGDRDVLVDPLKLPSGFPRMGDEAAFCLMRTAMYLATIRYRKDLLSRLVGKGMTIYGDEGWQDQLREATLRERTRYGVQTAEIYSWSEVSINATSAQMPRAVNQRVFDVPAAGGFLLSDAQPDLEELFEMGKEAVTYSCGEELVELVDYYRRHPSQREAIAQAGRARVLKEHTYVHRLNTLLEVMRVRYQ